MKKVRTASIHRSNIRTSSLIMSFLYVDLLHHEVNSLRQIYDVRSVKPTAPASQQIKPGTIFNTFSGKVEVLRIHTNETDQSDNGTVWAKVQTPNQAEKEMEIDLMKFQKFVTNKLSQTPRARKAIKHWLLTNNGSETKAIVTPSDQSSRLPFLEWPPPPPKNMIEAPSSEDDETMLLSLPGLKLHNKPHCEEESDSDNNSASSQDDGISSNVHRIIDDETCHSRRGVPCVGHDPAGVRDFITYTPFESTKCELCKSGGEDHYILICDDCDKGYHTYCLRPVVVNIPRGDWSCPQCTTGDTTCTSFEDIVEALKLNPREISSFLGLSFDTTTEFCNSHTEAFDLLRARSQWRSKFPKLRLTEKVGGIHISRNKDRHLFLLPEPPEDPTIMMSSVASIAAAVKYCGMEEYSEQLAYEHKVSPSMNNSSLDLDDVTSLNKKNLDLFMMYKENLKVGVYPPIEVVYDGNIGFLVKALAKMRKHTIVTEYVGEVTTIDQTGNTSSDSLMNLLQTGGKFQLFSDQKAFSFVCL